MSIVTNDSSKWFFWHSNNVTDQLLYHFKESFVFELNIFWWRNSSIWTSAMKCVIALHL